MDSYRSKREVEKPKPLKERAFASMNELAKFNEAFDTLSIGESKAILRAIEVLRCVWEGKRA